jgi:hypothetical protein
MMKATAIAAPHRLSPHEKDTANALAKLTDILSLSRCRNATVNRTGNLVFEPYLAGLRPFLR